MTTSTTSVWKLDGLNSSLANCFPARGIARQLHEGSGSWVVAYAEDQQAKIDASFKSKQQLLHQSIDDDARKNTGSSFKDNRKKCLNSAYLLQRHHVNSPSDLCSVNVSDGKLNDIEEDDLAKFVNVAYVNAAENQLPLEPFCRLTSLRELELPVNKICDLKLDYKDFPNLEVLDLSYNRLNSKDVLTLGVLQRLKVLTLTGNDLSSIHPDMARPQVLSTGAADNEVVARFKMLEVLYLDDNRLNDLSAFASLAALPQLRELNLDKNGIEVIPHLKVVGDRVISETHSSMGHHISIASSGKKSRQSIKTESEKLFDLNKEESLSDASHAIKNVNPASSNMHTFKEEDQNIIGTPDYSQGIATPNPPFQNLRLLSVANNRIREEECVLAVAAWPRLKHIVIHQNPIVDTIKGEPPLLSHYLKERLGINIHRFEKKTSASRPHFMISDDKARKVTTQIPKFPKQPVNVLINSLMAPSVFTNIHEDVDVNSIGGFLITERLKDEEVDGNNVFITQVDEAASGEHKEEKRLTSEANTSKVKDGKPKDFEDYKILLDAKEDDCPHEDAGIQGNVRILQQMMTHTKMLRANADVTLDRIVPAYEPVTSRHRSTMLTMREVKLRDKQEEIKKGLRKLRDREVIAVEIPLKEALFSDEFGHLADEAEDLLEEVERKYRIVREESLKTSQNIQSAFEETKRMMKDVTK